MIDGFLLECELGALTNHVDPEVAGAAVLMLAMIRELRITKAEGGAAGEGSLKRRGR